MKTITLSCMLAAAVLVGFVIGESHHIGALARIIDTPASTVALLAALFALISGVGGPLASFLIGSRQADIASRQASASATSADAARLSALNAGTRELANVRLAWLQALRDNLAEYHSILMSAEDPRQGMPTEEREALKRKWEADERRLSYLGTQLDLLLNRQKPLQKTLWDVSDKILNLKTKKERQVEDEALVVSARAVIDFEWSKIKREMRGIEPSNGAPRASDLTPNPLGSADNHKTTSLSTGISVLSFTVALFSAAFAYHTWNTGLHDARKTAAVDLSVKLMTDPKLLEFVARGDEFLKGASDAAHFAAALSLTQYYDYLALLLSSGKIDADYVSPQLKCQLVSWDAAALTYKNNLSPPVRDIAVRITPFGKNAIEYYHRNFDHLPCPS